MVLGIDALKRRFAAVPKIIVEEVLRETALGAGDVAAMARRLAPKDQGDLLASLRVEPLGQGGVIYRQYAKGSGGKIGHRVLYGSAATLVPTRGGRIQNARLQEFGTQEMPASPALFPALRANKERIRRRISSAVKKAMARA